MPTDHSYEEIYQTAVDLLSGRERPTIQLDQFLHLRLSVATLLYQRELTAQGSPPRSDERPHENEHDSEIFNEVFWDLFRQGIITLGTASGHEGYPFFRIGSYGKKFLEQNQRPYFFHDVSSYERIIKENIPDIDEVTLLYLKEAMQAFMSGCMLSSSVMLGVAAEHSFEQLLELIDKNPQYGTIFKSVQKERSILPKLNKFKSILDQHIGEFTPEIREDLDTNFSGIIAIIRNFRNESGHPSGKIVSREQCYILLQLFIPYCKKIYQLKKFFENQ